MKVSSMAHRLCIAFLLLLASVGSAVGQEINLLDRSGRQIAYVSVDRDNTIFLWAGEPVAYMHDDGRANYLSIYGFDGKHLGWFEDSIVWELSGDAVGFEEGTQDIATVRSGVKGVKRIPPLRRLRDLPKLKPVLSYRFSTSLTLSGFLQGSTGAPAVARPSTPSSGTQSYFGVGMRHWVQRVESGGTTVILEDGSRWEIQSIDRIYTMLWLPVDDVRVDNARSPIGAFSYTLTHTRDGRAVLARYMGR